MITLRKAQIIRLHGKLLEATGGLEGIRDEGMLDSALSAAFQTFDGAELYPSTSVIVQAATHPIRHFAKPPDVIRHKIWDD